MTRISKKLITWFLAVIACVAIVFGFAFTNPQVKTASADSVEVVWKDAGISIQDLGEYNRFLLQTDGLQWTSYNNISYEDNYLAYTKINGKTVKEINAEAAAAGSSVKIWACLQPANGFSFYSICIPKTFETLLSEDVFSLSVEPGWTHLDSSANVNYPGTGNTYAVSTQVFWGYRDDFFKLNTGKYADFSTASYTFANQGNLGDGSTCFLFSTRDTANFWTAYSTVLKMNNPILNALYINGKSVNDWNAEAQAAVTAGTATDICYGSTNANNTTAGAPIAVRPGYASDANIGAFFQIYIANEFLASSEITSFEWKEGFAFTATGTRDVYYTSKNIGFELLGASWRSITEFVDLGDGNMRVEDQGSGSYSGVNCFLIRFGVQEKIAGYLCFNDQYQRVSPITGLRYGQNLDYITINGKTIGQIKAENPNYNYSTSTHPNIKNGGSYAPIFAHMSSATFGGNVENFVQIYIPKDLIDPSEVTELGLKAGFFNLNVNETVKYGLTEDVTFVKENGSWGMKPIELDTEIVSIDASIQNFLTFGLSNHDYASIPANTGVDKARLTASGLWNYIEVNGVKLTNNTTSESVYNIYGRATNTYSVRLNQYAADNAEGDITSVTIKAGARFPSYAYNSTGAGIPIYYVVKEDVTFIYDSTNGWCKEVAPAEHTVTFVSEGTTFATQAVMAGEKATSPTEIPTKEDNFDYKYTFIGWYLGETKFDFNTPIQEDLILTAKFVEETNVKTIETSILSVEWGLNTNNFLAFELSAHDYTSVAIPKEISGGDAMLKATNALDKIYFDGTSARTFLKNLGTNPHLNIFTMGKFGFRVGTAGAAFPYEEIRIEAGCEFLSSAYIQGESKTLYVTTEALVFRTIDNGKTWYNTATQCTVTFVDGDGNTFATQQVLAGTTVTMPEGTPTKEHDETYKYDFIGWYLGGTEFDFENTKIIADTTITAEFSKVAITSILSVEWGVNSNNFLAFELSAHDYTGVAVPKEISGGDAMLKATNMLDMIYLDGTSARDLIGGGGTNPHLNIFTMGKFGFRIGTAGGEFSYQRITIKAGCEFLSNAYIQGTSETLYVTAEDFTFVNWYGTYVEENSIPVTQIVDIVRLTYTEQENWLVFTFDAIDYPKSNDTFNYEIPSTYLDTLRFFDYIEVSGTIYLNHYESGQITGVDVVEKATLADIYKYNGKPGSGMLNIWKQQNTFAIRILSDKNRNENGEYSIITSITIKEGAEFPSYQAAVAGNANATISYMLLNQVEFEKEADEIRFTCMTDSSYGIDMWMSQGAAVRIAGAKNYNGEADYMETEGYKYSGIRFQTNISTTAIAELEKKLEDGTYLSVSFGTLIVPSQYLVSGQFTHEWLDKNGKEYMDIPSTAGIGKGWAIVTEDYVSYFGSIVNLKAQNHARNFAGLGYALVEKADGTFEYFYAPYETSYARSAAYVAQMAIADRAATETGYYKHEVSANGNWSPYTDNERAFLGLYLGTLAESVISARDLSASLATINSTTELDMKKNGVGQQIGSYIHLTYSTNINILGTLVYSSKPGATEAECVKEEFYLQAGSGEHKQYLDLFRKNGLGYYNGTPGSYSSTRLINPNSIYIQKIILKNVELEAGVTPQVQFVGFRSTYKTLETSDLPGNSVHLYLTREQTEDEQVPSEYNEVTLGANLALGGALTYLAKSGVYEGLTSTATSRSGSWGIKNYGQYTGGTVGMSTDTSVFKYKDPISGLYYIGGSGVGSSKPGVGVNLISNQDVGRQIQQSYYAAVGGTDDATNGENGYTRAYCYTESSSGKYWPYNPVQAGDCGNNTSQIIDYELNTDKNYIYVKTRAMDWAQGIDDRLNGLMNQNNAINGGRTTKSYMENYYYLNADGTVKVDNSFVDWNGFTSMETCGWQSNELPATIISHNLAYYVSNRSTSASDAWTGALTYINRPESHLQTDVDGTAFDGRKYENWYAWSIDNKGTFALGMYIPNVSSFSTSVIVSSNSLSEARNANANNKGNSRVCTFWTESGTEMYYDFANLRAGWESCYVFNSSYTAPSTAYRMEEYKTMQYSYVISLNSVDTIRSQFKEIYDSGSLTNGGKIGEKIGLDAWARQDKVWTW